METKKKVKAKKLQFKTTKIDVTYSVYLLREDGTQKYCGSTDHEPEILVKNCKSVWPETTNSTYIVVKRVLELHEARL